MGRLMAEPGSGCDRSSSKFIPRRGLAALLCGVLLGGGGVAGVCGPVGGPHQLPLAGRTPKAGDCIDSRENAPAGSVSPPASPHASASEPGELGPPASRGLSSGCCVAGLWLPPDSSGSTSRLGGCAGVAGRGSLAHLLAAGVAGEAELPSRSSPTPAAPAAASAPLIPSCTSMADSDCDRAAGQRGGGRGQERRVRLTRKRGLFKAGAVLPPSRQRSSPPGVSGGGRGPSYWAAIFRPCAPAEPGARRAKGPRPDQLKRSLWRLKLLPAGPSRSARARARARTVQLSPQRARALREQLRRGPPGPLGHF